MGKETKELQKIVKDTMKAILSDENFISLIVKTVTDQVSTKLEEMLTKYRKKIDECEERLVTFENENEKLKMQVNRQEQYQKRNCIRIFGIEENENENVDDIIHNLFNKTMKLKLNINTSVESCFRVGIRSSKTYDDNDVARTSAKTIVNPRAIVVKFMNYRERQKVIESRKLLKSSGVVIKEDLIKSQLQLLKMAITKYTSRNVWTMDGIIYTSINNRKKIIRSASDLDM